MSPPGSSIDYEISDNASTTSIPLPNQVYTPSECLYGLLYEAKTIGGDNLPQWLSFDPVNGFTVLSGNPNDFGTYLIELTATVDGPNTVSEIDLIYTFTLGRC